jgi:hypothetical protein
VTYINWDVVFHIDPATLQPAASGVPIPTYGNYGGAGYSEGAFGPPVPPLVAPVDALDRRFLRHDLASAAADTPEEQEAADARLLRQILRFEPGELDAEASLYGGFAALAVALRLTADGDPDPFSPRRLAHAAAEAVEDIGRGLAGLEPGEYLEALGWLGEARDALAASGIDIGDVLEAAGPGQVLPGDWPL